MISPVVDSNKWASDYNISVAPIECPDCKKPFVPSVPLALPGYRGLMLSNHGCGDLMPFRVVPVGDKREFWERMFGASK